MPGTGGFGDQNSIEMDTILELDSLYEKMLEQERENRKEDIDDAS